MFCIIVFDLSPLNTCSTDYIELIDINVATNTETVRSKYCAGVRIVIINIILMNKLVISFTYNFRTHLLHL